jgi:hypothetical protein
MVKCFLVEKERFAMQTIKGTVHGRTIELLEDTGLIDGQEVEVFVQIVPNGKSRTPGEGLLRTEGALAGDPYWDEIMETIHRERKTDMRKDIVE